jgi:hypothetical protein
MEFHFDLESPRKSLVSLGVGLEVRRTSRENEVFLENLEADIRSRDRTYGLKYHSGCTVSRLDVRSEVSQRTYGLKPERTA